MYEVVTAKFTQNENLKAKLRSTANKTLVECNPNDPFWGIGLGLGNPNIWDQGKWKGTNKLGEILGRIREEMR